MKHPVSIVIPHYQKQTHLYQLLGILDSQLYGNSEIIVVDDYSPDGVDAPDGVKVVRPETKRNEQYRLNHLRNLGVETAKNDCIVILDPDCHPASNRFIEYASQMFDPSILYGGRIDYVEEDKSLRLDRRGENSKWLHNSFNIYGGCMMFSKRRTKLVGWFSDEYNGGWGADDNDFAAKCHHSGMRLRFSKELRCMHQWHVKTRPNKKRNYEIYHDKIQQYRDTFNYVTPWRPSIGAMIISMNRPELVSQAVSGVLRGGIPVKVRLVNNGDCSKEQRNAFKPWLKRWTVDVVNHVSEKHPSVIRNESLWWAKQNRLKYLLMIDDDIVPKPGALQKLINVLETKPEVYAVSGYQERGNPPKRQLLGGNFGERGVIHPPLTDSVNIVDCVSGGFTLVRVNPQIYFDETYETGLNDYDWSMIIGKNGWKLANTGKAGCWHKYIWSKRGKELYRNPSDYNKKRHDRERHYRMDQKFFEKWGFHIMKKRDD